MCRREKKRNGREERWREGDEEEEGGSLRYDGKGNGNREE